MERSEDDLLVEALTFVTITKDAKPNTPQVLRDYGSAPGGVLPIAFTRITAEVVV
ncbi:hypothetical protein AMC90_PA00070 (plasmid) [Rhizobium phaseoli]|uniref:Uncharacterized protein n=1 Tax=Rhizobium phaseoli TaxID=396 RepID=A0ABM6CLA6_9HYPH|nr:hypothetical protein [Rhizobium phaseoli]ANL30180.1 hypothetical protein AMC90_PA00070 [Rhizobium phaseoli]ANL89160.1 hypothetical protein AMC81_PE00917 [Rhizobium phaseoli]ANL95669.1 hypothetical protein AMC80_PE00917 [Rhizobium phaseoli]KEC71274.1 hypothetical protein RLPCCGM1_p0005 [Rhizobium leguminosarum bv. phaseoli CCGM1]